MIVQLRILFLEGLDPPEDSICRIIYYELNKENTSSEKKKKRCKEVSQKLRKLISQV